MLAIITRKKHNIIPREISLVAEVCVFCPVDVEAPSLTCGSVSMATSGGGGGDIGMESILCVESDRTGRITNGCSLRHKSTSC